MAKSNKIIIVYLNDNIWLLEKVVKAKIVFRSKHFVHCL